MQATDACGNRFIATNTVFLGGNIWVEDWSLEYSLSGRDFLMNVNSDGSVSMPTDENGQPTGTVPTVTITAASAGYFITPSNGVGLGSQQGRSSQPKDTVPMDFKARVLDIVGNCADILNRFFDALGSQVYSRDLGKLLDRINKIEIAEKPFRQPYVHRKAAGLSVANGNDRRIFIRPASWNNNPAYQQFRWNAIANTIVSELLHHARTTGTFSDENLDEAALDAMKPSERATAVAAMGKKGYVQGTVGHRYIKEHCVPTHPYGAPPVRR